MRVAIMQPYFFPYLGYFSLIQAADLFILFDTVQFQRKSWMTRNRILSGLGEFTYIHVPTKKAPLQTHIKDIEINNESNWKETLLQQLLLYKKAPYHKETMAVIKKILQFETTSLVQLNKKALQEITAYLEMSCEIVVFSEMGLTIETASEADEWALNISKALGAAEYINPPGGVSFFDKNKYQDNQIQLTFIENNLPHYQQFQANFVPGLSIIDAMMFNSKEAIINMIQNTKQVELVELIERS